MGKTLYLECASGISGDMFVAALLDLGADEARLRATLASLPLSGYELCIGDVSKNGVRAHDFDVRLDDGLDNHDHDMAWLYGHLEGDGEGHAHEDGHDHGHCHDEEADGHEHRHAHTRAHAHEHAHGHDGHAHAHEAICGDDGAQVHDEAHTHAHGHAHAHHHEHRGLADVMAVIDAGALTPRAHAVAVRVFEVLAEAETAAHGTTPDQVHFHEVGAVDSIVDIVSAAVCLDELGVDEVVVPYLCEGQGTVRCAHGILPVPVPAVCATVSQHGIALHVLPVQGELVTPTGAAIVAATRTRDRLPETFRIVKTGVGAGKRDNRGTSGILRAHLIESGPHGGTAPATVEASPEDGTVWKLECDVDDCTGEALGHCMGELLAAGAKEAHFLPIQTKKNRPAWQIQVICDEGRREALENVLFLSTTTIGVRRARMERTVLPRAACEVETPLGPVAAKAVTLPDGRMRTRPEHDGVAALAEANSVSYQEAWRCALASMPPESPCGRA